MKPEQLFLSQLGHIERVVQHACRRSRFRKEEAEDFASTVKLKLIEDDYGVFRKFQGKSSLGTYLNVVVQRLMLDYQNHLWGKWRPSAEAEKLGEEAIRLEALLVRDGYSFDEATEILRTRDKISLAREDLAAIAIRLPRRYPRRMESENGLTSLPAPDSSADALPILKEKLAKSRKTREALRHAMKVLDPEDRIILQMQCSKFTVAEIARRLGYNQAQLYRRIGKILDLLRREMEAQGIRKKDIREIFEE